MEYSTFQDLSIDLLSNDMCEREAKSVIKFDLLADKMFGELSTNDDYDVRMSESEHFHSALYYLKQIDPALYGDL